MAHARLSAFNFKHKAMFMIHLSISSRIRSQLDVPVLVVNESFRNEITSTRIVEIISN